MSDVDDLELKEQADDAEELEDDDSSLEEYKDEPDEEGEEDDEDEEELEDDDDDEGGNEGEEAGLLDETPDPRGQPAEYYQADYDPRYEPDEDNEDQGFKDEPEEKRTWRERIEETDRSRLAALILCCCCCCCLIVIFLLLFVVLDVTKSSSDDSPNSSPSAPSPSQSSPVIYPTQAPIPLPPSALPPPTQFPTRTPVPTAHPVVQPTPKPTLFPTAAPTISFAPTKGIPDELFLTPGQDTYITNTFDHAEARGDEETILIQNGDDFVNENPDCHGFLQFDLSDIPFARIQNRINNATLVLQHEVSILDRGSATYWIQRLPSTSLVVETFYWNLAKSFLEKGIGNVTFEVSPSDDSVTVDISSLLFGGVYEPEDDDQLFLMISNYGAIQETGDRFYTRESSGNEPLLHLTFEKIPGVPDSTAAPVSPPTIAPSVSLNGTESPSIIDDEGFGNFTNSTD